MHTHVDTHTHVHTSPGIYSTCVASRFSFITLVEICLPLRDRAAPLRDLCRLWQPSSLAEVINKAPVSAEVRVQAWDWWSGSGLGLVFRRTRAGHQKDGRVTFTLKRLPFVSGPLR